MPKFSQESFSKLSTCHIDLQTLFYEVIKHFDCKILEGHRNQVEQDRVFTDGKSKLKWPDGKHNATPSIAVDVCPYPVPDFKNLSDFVFFGGFVMGIASMLKDQNKITHAIRYGADWKNNQRISDEKFIDAVHFELVS